MAQLVEGCILGFHEVQLLHLFLVALRDFLLFARELETSKNFPFVHLRDLSVESYYLLSSKFMALSLSSFFDGQLNNS